MIRNRAVLEATRDAIFLADAETGMVIDANAAAEALCGRSLAELRLLHHTQLHPPEQVELARRGFARDMQHPGITEGTVLHKDGHRIPVEIATSHFTDPNARHMLIGVFRDVTERNAARESLRRSEERFRQIAENAGEFIWEVDANGLYLYASPVVKEILGYTSEEVVGAMHFYDFFVPENRDEMKAAAFEVFARRESFRAFPNLNVRKDGRIVALETSGVPVFDSGGNFVGYRGVDRDITERQRVEEELRDSELKYRRLHESITDAVVIVDMAGVILESNPAYQAMLGYSTEELRRLTYQELTPERWHAFEAQIVAEQVLAKGHSEVYEKEYRRRDGTVFPIELRTYLLRDERSRPVGMWAIVRDITGRRQAEAALRESEGRFRTLADNAPVLIWAAGPDKLCTFFNKPWLDFTGRSMEEEVGNGWADGVHPDDLRRCLAHYSSSFDARRNFQMQYRLRRADGEYRWLMDNGVPLYRDGEFVGYIGSCVDVTEQKLNEERLRASELHLREAQRLTKVGSWELDLEADRLHWSEEIFRIHGLPKEAPSNFQALLARVHPNDRRKLMGADQRVRSSTAPVDIEFRIIREDGEVRILRSTFQAVRNEQGVPIRIAGASQDITEEVKARELLRQSEERLRNAERIAHLGNWRWDVKAKEVSWSEELLRIFGNPQPCTPSYEQFLQVVVPQQRERVAQWVESCLAGHHENSLEFQIVRPDGDVRTVSCIIEVSREEEGLPAYVSGTCQDSTDSRRAQEEAFARQKLESVGTLARGIAHDFNNILGGVLAQAEAALAEVTAGKQSQQELERIRDLAIQGSEIVSQLLSYAGKESEDLELIDVSRIVAEMVGLMRVSVSKRALLQTELGENLPAIRANTAQLRRIVMNLVTNASEAIGDRDGVIRVNTARVTVDRATAASKGITPGEYLQLTVSDNGVGMPLEIQVKVFDPFFTTRTAGRGLGLAVVQGIVRNLRGAVHVTSRLGKGTTFQVLLPCAGASVPPGPPAALPEPVRPVRTATVLLVEDEDSLRQPVSKMLRKAGFSIIEASDGSAGLEAIRGHANPIDVLLLDISLPGTSSRDLLHEAKHLRPEMKVIVTSAYSQESAAASLGEKIEFFLRKPYLVGHLMDLVRRVLS